MHVFLELFALHYSTRLLHSFHLFFLFNEAILLCFVDRQFAHATNAWVLLPCLSFLTRFKVVPLAIAESGRKIAVKLDWIELFIYPVEGYKPQRCRNDQATSKDAALQFPSQPTPNSYPPLIFTYTSPWPPRSNNTHATEKSRLKK